MGSAKRARNGRRLSTAPVGHGHIGCAHHAGVPGSKGRTACRSGDDLTHLTGGDADSTRRHSHHCRGSVGHRDGRTRTKAPSQALRCDDCRSTGMTTRIASLPIFQGLRPLAWTDVPTNLVAGIALAAMNIPQSLAYTKIAGTPAITGLYTLVLPLVAFAVFGSSRYLVVAADSATAAILAGSLAEMAPIASARYVALAGIVALLTGGLAASLMTCSLRSTAAIVFGSCRNES